MSISPADYEKLGLFYLGRDYDAATKQTGGNLLLYDSRDLVTHGVVLGMTGSGKTGLCLTMLEEAAMDNIPAIVVDPKGDIANLALTFPELDGASFRPWINEDDAQRKGVSPDEFAASTAGKWKAGLAEWGQDGERIRALREKTDVVIFTPGSRAGIPVSILASLEPPPFEVLDDAEALAERVESTVASLLSLAGVDTGSAPGPAEVLLASIFQHVWNTGAGLTLETLIRHIQRPPFDKVGVLDLETFYQEKERHALALRFNNLLASPGFSTWLEGVPLDIAGLLRSPSGKPRIAVFSTAHLDDSGRMFFTSLLLNQLLGWMRAQHGTTSLRALFYMDEIFGYLPPTANPPSKKPMMTLLKQARAFGLGCLLATQNPVDLDYKALSNIGTWFLGRLQTERDRARVLDGLQAAADSQNAAGFDRPALERLLAGLSARVFLMNNVHENGPVLFQVRWAMSYLRGPLTRGQIKTLMDPLRPAFSGAAAPSDPAAAANPMAMPGLEAQPAAARPPVGLGVTELFIPPAGGGAGVIYRPYLLRRGMTAFTSRPLGVDDSREKTLINPILDNGIAWDDELRQAPSPERAMPQPADGAAFATLPGFAMNAANYKQVEKDFAEWLYRNERAEIHVCKPLKENSAFGESEADFRARLQQQAREARDAATEKIRAAAEKRIAALETKRAGLEDRLTKQKAQATSSKIQAGASVLGGLLSGILGRKINATTISRGSTAVGRTTTAFKQSQDVGATKRQIAELEEQKQTAIQELEAEIMKISDSMDPATLPLETETLSPTRTNVKVLQTALLWLPFDDRGDRAW